MLKLKGIGISMTTLNNLPFGLTGVLGVPYTRNRQYAGVTAAGGPVDELKPIEQL